MSPATVKTLFDKPKAVVGMIHVGALPGTPRNSESPDSIIERACAEGRTLARASVNTLLQRLVGDALGFKWPAPMGAGDESKQDDLIRLLADLRQEARQARNYELSDKIRDRLTALGVNLRDTPQGPAW